MCNTHSAGHAHGVRSDAEKAVADLRDDLIEELKLITKYEAQIPVIAAEDFPSVDDVVHVLGHIRDDHKHAARTLIEFINRLDAGQKTVEAHDASTSTGNRSTSTTLPQNGNSEGIWPIRLEVKRS